MMKVLPCPMCENQRAWMLRGIGMRKKKYYLVCSKCQFAAETARTPWGAVRAWNKACKRPGEHDF